MMNTRLLLATSTLLALGMSAASARPPAPPPPAEYAVQFRYRIQAGRNERIPQFYALLDFLKSIGFKKDEGPDNEPEDANLTRMTGTIASARARELLREPHIKSVLLMPVGYKLPAEPEQPVKVHIELAPVFPDRQRLLADQVRAKLRLLGFREAAGYDNRGHTRLVGTIPAGAVGTLLKDLRWQPEGWLAPMEGVASLPNPLRSLSPILVTEIVPEPEGVAPVQEVAAPPIPQGQEFLSPDLRQLLTQEAEAARPRRLEVILARPPGPDDQGWRLALAQAAPELVVDGRLGELVTVVVPASRAPALAALPVVSAVRLPRSGEPQIQPAAGGKDANRAALQASGLARLHTLGHRGKGIRLAIIDGDFRGYQEMIAQKRLPANTRTIDITAIETADLKGEPEPGDPKALGVGTQYALAAALAAPDAEMVLIRVNPSAPYQLQLVARAINCEPIRSEGVDRRRDELLRDDQDLRTLRAALQKERNIILNEFGQDEATKKRREAYFAKEAEFDRQYAAYQDRMKRYDQLWRGLQDLPGTRIVASSLVWNEGHPVDGSSPLSRYLDDYPFRAAFWLQSAGNTRGQVWAGPFRDRDGNGVMEFGDPRARLRWDRWTTELDFLGWQPFKRAEGEPGTLPDLPAKATLRFSLQWREPHDPDLWQAGRDYYRQPLANLRLVLLRQRDPSGTRLPAEEMEVVAQSAGPPLRLQNLPNCATYEQMLEYTVDRPGRYAMRIEGQVPAGIRPPTAPVLRGPQKTWELRARAFVDVVDQPSRAAGRPIFLDYATDQGGIGMPGDAQAVITIGSADPANHPQLYSATGPAFELQLAPKPDALAYDDLHVAPQGVAEVQGTSLATSFAAGTVAAAMSAGIPPIHFAWSVQAHPGKVLAVPKDWSPRR